MIKVLQKAFEVIQCISENGTEMTPTAIAQSLGINLATCVRILRELMALGYVEQSGPRQGYGLSMQGWATFSRHPIVERLLAEGSPLISQYAQKTRQCFFLCVVRQARRYTIFYRNGHPTLNLVPQKIVYDDCHITAAGQLLIALSPQSVRQDYLKQCPAHVDRQALVPLFDRIQKQGYVLMRRKEEFHAIAAYPVFMFDRPVAAVSVCMVGDGMTDMQEQALMTACRDCARDLSARLGVHLA